MTSFGFYQNYIRTDLHSNFHHFENGKNEEIIYLVIYFWKIVFRQ